MCLFVSLSELCNQWAGGDNSPDVVDQLLIFFLKFISFFLFLQLVFFFRMHTFFKKRKEVKYTIYFEWPNALSQEIHNVFYN